MSLRKIFFWIHLTAGCIAGAVILLMSATGVLLTYERQLIAWSDRGFRSGPPPGVERRLAIGTLLANVPGTPASLSLKSDPLEPATVNLGRAGNIYVNPWTGQVLGEGSKPTRKLMQQIRGWHRWLAIEGPGRAAARAITGACNVAFLFMVVSGLYLWWPRCWTKRCVGAVTLFRGGLSGKARDFNWHNVFGFWMAIPLFFIVISGVTISYPWAGNLLYRAPSASAPPGASGVSLSKLNEGWARAERQVSGWQTITLRLPSSDAAPLVFTIDGGTSAQPQYRSTLTLNRANGGIEKLETFDDLALGFRLRRWARFTHTGEAFGVVGQTIAGIASFAGVMLVWTGISLSLRRFRTWRDRRAALAIVADAAVVPAHAMAGNRDRERL